MATSQAVSYPWHQIMPQLGAPEDFRTLRQLLEACDYSNETLCRRLGVENLWLYNTPKGEALATQPMETPIDAMIRLFLDCLYLEDSVVQRLLPKENIAALESLGLLLRDPDRPELRYSTAALFHAGGVLTACDRGIAPDGTRCPLPEDIVYPAVFENTREFLERIPRTACDAMLEIGTGTGVAAIIGSQFAKQVWATDISSRAVRFAEFNRRLAGLDNVTVVDGDMYAPVEGLTFDLIVTHPPYVPARKPKFVFRDGGEDGEQIFRRVVEGAPRFLRPGGRLVSLLIGTDREGESFEQRIRKWLGPEQASFDVVLASERLNTPKQFIAYTMSRKKTPLEEIDFWQELWQNNKTEYIFYGAVTIRRHEGGRPPVTARAQEGRGYNSRHTSWLLDWWTRVRQPNAADMLLGSRPALSPHTMLKSVSRVREGRFVPEHFALETKQPFETLCECQPWLAEIVSRCNGSQTWRELFEAGRAEGFIHPEAPPEEFAQLLGSLVGGGLLLSPDLPLPE
jgi:SAM-dependent methyltransferase